MTQESNRYAKLKLSEEEYSAWAPISINEIKKFILLIMYMGICKLPTYELYWNKKNNVFSQNFPNSSLSLARFKEIKRFFHVLDSETSSEVDPLNPALRSLNWMS
jgi:hypothetical protein